MVELTEARNKNIGKLIRKAGLEPDTIDVKALWDSSLSYQENKEKIEEAVCKNGGKAKEMTATEIKEEERKTREHNIGQAKEEEERLLQEWRGKSVKLEHLPVYKMFDRYLDMQKQGYSFGTLICGETGLSKTFRAVGILDGEDMAYLNTYTTPLAFYMWLYHNREKDCIIDDVEGIWKDKKALSMLKGSLGEVKGKRIVQYHSTKDLEIPTTFEMTGTMTLIYNEIPDNANVDAVLSRINYVDMNLSYAERLATINKIAQEPYKELTVEERMMIVEYVESVTNPTIRNLNFRTLFRIFECYRYDKNAWKEMADDILQADEELSIIHEAMSRGLSTNEMFVIYRQETGKSRASFFRKKKELQGRMRSQKVSKNLNIKT